MKVEINAHESELVESIITSKINVTIEVEHKGDLFDVEVNIYYKEDENYDDKEFKYVLIDGKRIENIMNINSSINALITKHLGNNFWRDVIEAADEISNDIIDIIDKNEIAV